MLNGQTNRIINKSQPSIRLFHSGFTLAEVLIVIGIIGVVAAILIPTITKNVQEYSWKQAWKKEYSTIAQAYELVKLDEGGSLDSYFDSSTNYISKPILSLIANKLGFIKECADAYTYICGNNSNIAVSSAYKTLSNASVSPHDLYYKQYVLKDGANFYSRSYSPIKTLIFIDVNGYSKKPNVLGKDLFGVVITKDKVMPMGALGSDAEKTCTTTAKFCYKPDYGFSGYECSGAGCSAEYLYN